MGLDKLKSIFENYDNTENRYYEIDLDFKNDYYPINHVDDSVLIGSDIPILSEYLKYDNSSYNSLSYDPRLERPRRIIFNKNPYKGTSFDDEVGGIFNTRTNKYHSEVFGTNPTLKQILTKGNIEDKQGYVRQYSSYEKYKESESASIVKYYENGEMFIPQSPAKDTNVSNIPILDKLELKEHKLGKGDLIREKYYNDNHTSPKSDRLNIRYGNSGFRGEEPYNVYEIGKNTQLFGRMPISRELPIFRATDDLLRIGKFMLSPKGLWFIASENIRGALLFKNKFMGMGGLGWKYHKRWYSPLSTLGAISVNHVIGYNGTGGFVDFDRQWPIPSRKYENDYSEYGISKDKMGLQKIVTVVQIKIMFINQ